MLNLRKPRPERYTVIDAYYLIDCQGDTEVLCGPTPEMVTLAHWLSADVPTDTASLRQRVQDFIMLSRGCSFAPGPGLKRGMP
jgi:hypothetical protein